MHSFLSGVKTEDAKSMPEGSISLDQRAAEYIGSSSRFLSLTVGSETGLHGGCQMCWTRTGSRIPPITSPRELFHKLSHHRKNPKAIADLLTIESYQMHQMARFIDKLKTVSANDEDGSLFDRTMVLFGSGMGNGNAHTKSNLPMLPAGAGFRHGEHTVDSTSRRVPLSNLVHLWNRPQDGNCRSSWNRSAIGTIQGKRHQSCPT